MQGKNKKNIGIIGCGLIADTHVEAIRKAIPEANISVCDILNGKADLLRRKYELKSAFTSIEEMLEKEMPFSVHILSPPQYHIEHARKCLQAGAHVLVEKPLGFSSKEVDDLYNDAKENRRVLCVDHSLLCQPSVVKMFEKIKSIGGNRVLYVNSIYGMDVDISSYSVINKNHWKNIIPGGPSIDTVIHPLSLAIELTGKPNDIRVLCSSGEYGTEENHISWKGEKGIVSIIISMGAKPFRRVTEITTNKQTLILDHSTETLVSLEPGFGPKSVQKVLRNVNSGWQLIAGTISTAMKAARGKLQENPGTRNLIGDYYKYLAGQGEIPVSEENVKNATYALEEIVASLAEKYKTKELRNSISSEAKDKGEKGREIVTLVTGASGLLGRHLCEMLPQKNRIVKAQVRRGQNADKISSPNVEKYFMDFKYFKDSDYDRLVQGMDEVIHCAHATGANTWREYKDINVDATLKLYEAAIRAGCEKFIFFSSAAVYGVHHKGAITVSEETPIISGNSRWDFYVRSKSMAEKELIKRRGEIQNPKLLIIRPGILFTAEGIGLFRRSVPIKDGRLFILFGNGQNHLPYTRVDILARKIIEILEAQIFPEGVYNLTGNSEENVMDFIAERANNQGFNAKFMRIPKGPSRNLAATAEFLYFITFRKKPPKVTRYIIDSSSRDIYYDCSKARRDMGWDSKAAHR
jgi:predicted dehydrogenase/nucleoside-diphosphate-sugar epimerase